MRIIIVGDGKMGSTFAQRLSKAGHDVTIIDKRATALQHTIESLDIVAIEGNGTTLEIQREAGVEQADLLIAATNTDEQNLLTCLIAKRAGAKHHRPGAEPRIREGDQPHPGGLGLESDHQS